MRIGKLLVRGLGAGMEAYGTSLLEKDERQQKERESQALVLRQMALARYNSDLNREEAVVGGAITRQNQSHAGAINVATHRANTRANAEAEAALLPAKTKATIDVNAAREAVEQTNRERLAKLTSKLRMDENAQEAALRLENELTVAGTTAARWEVTNDGAMVALNARGQVIGTTPKNVFVPPSRGKSSDSEATSVGDFRPGGGKPSGKPAARSAAPAQDAWRSQLGTAKALYPDASPEELEEHAKTLFRKYGR